MVLVILEKFNGMNIRYFIFLLLIIFLNINCSAQKDINKDKGVEVLDESKKFEFTYYLFEAENNYLNQQYDLAEGYYQKCLVLDPSSALVNYKLASIYLYKNDVKTSVYYIDRCLANNDKNIWYLYFAGSIYQKNKDFAKAIMIYQDLIELNDKEIDFYLSLADVYLQEGNYKKALKIYNNIDEVFGVQESVIMQKHKIYVSLGKKEKAAEEINKLIEANNQDPYYLRLLAEFYVQINEVIKAENIYKKILIDNPKDGYSNLGLAECYRLKGNFEDAILSLQTAFRSNDIPSDVKVGIIINMLKGLEKDNSLLKEILNLVEILVQLYPNDPDINALYADFQLKLGNIDIARSALLKVIEVKKDKYEIWEQILLIDNQFLDWSNLYKHSKEALNYFPNQPLIYFFKGFSAFQLSFNEESKKALELGYQILTKDDVLNKDFLTFLGEVNYKLGFKKEAYAYFDKLLEIDPENIMILNNYGYYLSLDKQNLDKAEKMSLLTVKKESENPTYLDTYAWILFEKGDYKRALEYIVKAVNFNNNASDVIIEHYGDILYFNNQIEEAVNQWNNALKIGIGSGKINEKIENKKYIE